MKKYIYIILSIFTLGGVTSCLDNFEEANTNPNKMYNTNIQLVFPGTVYRTLNVFGKMNYVQYLNYSRQLMLLARFINLREGDMDSYYVGFYVNILRDLSEMENQYEKVEGAENRLMIIKTWKALVYSIMASTWGPMPMSDAMMTFPDKKDYKYDSEKDMYIQVLDLLKTATENFNPNPTNEDFLKPDPVFGGNTKSNIEKWRKFANTLRLDVALRIQNIDKNLAEEHIKAAMQHEEWLISSLNDMVQPSWGTDPGNDVSYYYNEALKNLTESNFSSANYPRIAQYFFTYLQSYQDPRLEKFVDPTDPKDRYAVLDTIRIKRISSYSGFDTTMVAIVKHSIPHCPAPELPGIPITWEPGYDPNSNNGQGTDRYQNPYRDIDDKKGWSYVNKSFLKQDTKVVFLNWASTCFMKAEAKLKFGIGSKSAQQYYEDGIAASFAEYGTTDNLSSYMAQDGVKWNTNGKGLSDCMQIYYCDINGANDPFEQIVKQRWIAEYFNGFACWVLDRRTRILNLPPMFYNGSGPGLEGSNDRFEFAPERFIYSINERATNRSEYDKAIQTLQKNSPKGDAASRWGDNLWTHLNFAKVNPALAGADAKWSNRTFIWNQHAIQNQYGKTEEDLIKNAHKEFPQITDTIGLKTYLKYEIVEIVKPR
ncbi:SusD/RagB family nutrient-binding outer membrane lipoprotein [Dysgonomonas sp. HGC4]|uniref:SusD/RagB family nutrient-binding outer membrane lipoprotein n=1 Tax=Dysgonomonas sp. HGC4 TaxID=1658009 RepID=UPI0016182147|nr:SusD/RagB family nutrient-binding outer membrane lipoprotein [Dysgonomonas sp. HGC4]MBD8347868.1 SusD/RagB family nutrient-binding outer membrane lipoprotein [Dysgonomonas sp. HGC4]